MHGEGEKLGEPRRDISELYRLAPSRFRSRDAYGIARLVNTIYPGLICDVKFEKTSISPLITSCIHDPEGFHFVFNACNDDLIDVIMYRWLALLDAIWDCRCATPFGKIDINLGDQGHGLGLTFCDNQRFENLIPDSDFLSSYGYEEARQYFSSLDVAWSARLDKALWRGTTTGHRDASGSVSSLPRVRLCKLSKSSSSLDCGFVSFFQISAEEQIVLIQEGLQKAFIKNSEYVNYRYHIDIDGNTNAWSGLFTKLLSGGVVLKVASTHGFRQWYYDKLIPWHNFVPIKSDLSDLDQILTELQSDQKRAEGIGAEGRNLAQSLDYISQKQFTRVKIHDALKGHGMQQQDPENLISTIGNADGLLSKLLENAVNRACLDDGKISPAVLGLEGMSGKRYRFAINNLIASLPRARYLEVGSWAGSTSCAAMEGNRVRAVCIDNWSEFGGPKEDFLKNTAALKGPYADFQFIESDFRAVQFDNIGTFNVYLFDGPHDEKDQYDGLFLALPALDEQFVFIVDDWNWDYVRRGTMSAIKASHLDIEFAIEVRSTLDNSHPELCRQHSNWHNGYFLGVLRKNRE